MVKFSVHYEADCLAYSKLAQNLIKKSSEALLRACEVHTLAEMTDHLHIGQEH